MHKGGDCDCEVLSVMMRHLNILESNLFGPELFTFNWDFIDSDKATITRYDLLLRFFVLMLRYCANLKAMRYESTSFNRIAANKSHRVIAA